MNCRFDFQTLQRFLEKSLISLLLKKVMEECNLKQADLATVLDVSLSRVKAMTSGRVAKFTPEETRRLVQTLNLSAHWLATGEGPMFNTQGGQKLGEILTQLRLTTARLAEMEIDGPVASAVVSIVQGVAEKDADSLKDGLIQAAYAMQTPDERALLDTYRRCTHEAKANLIQTAALLSAGMSAPNAPSSPSAMGSNNQIAEVMNSILGFAVNRKGSNKKD